MPDDSDATIEEWKQFSVDFDPELEIDVLDEEDGLEVIHDGEL